jgi:hypothetical protein
VEDRKREALRRFDAGVLYVLLTALTIAASGTLLLLAFRVDLAHSRLEGLNEYLHLLAGSREFWAAIAGLSGLLALETLGPLPRTGRRVLFQCGVAVSVAVAFRAGSGFPSFHAGRYRKPPRGWDLPLVLTPNKCAFLCRGKGLAWCATECTNAWGFRGDLPEAARKPGSAKVLLLGDSYVYGSGVDDAGRLDVALQGYLSKHDARRWEVSNFALPGLNFGSDVRIAGAAAPRFRPDFVVVGFLKCNDLEELDSMSDAEAYGERRYRFAQLAGIPGDIEEIARGRYACARTRDLDAPPSAAVAAKFRADLAKLRELRKRFHFQLIVFSYFGPSALFAEAQRDGDLTVLSPPDPLWQLSRELLAIPGDGHPTAAGNARFARQLGDAILAARARP